MFGIHPGVDAVDLQWKLYEERQAQLKNALNEAARDSRAEQRLLQAVQPKPVFKPAALQI